MSAISLLAFIIPPAYRGIVSMAEAVNRWCVLVLKASTMLCPALFMFSTNAGIEPWMLCPRTAPKAPIFCSDSIEI